MVTPVTCETCIALASIIPVSTSFLKKYQMAMMALSSRVLLRKVEK